MTDLSEIASKRILEDGCFSSENFLDTGKCTQLKDQIVSLVSKYDLYKTAEHDDVIVANHTTQREVNGKLGDYSKPVIVTRGLNGFDKNMTEIFNVHKLVPVPTQDIESFVQKVVIGMGHSGAKLEYSAYINKRVTEIRGFHRDVNVVGNKTLYKMFVYLTDVPDYTYGPHSYIPGTHRLDVCHKYANQLIGNYTDPNEYDFDLKPEVFTGPRGTMVMTTQAGMHRGLPQMHDKERILLVCKIRPY